MKKILAPLLLTLALTAGAQDDQGGAIKHFQAKPLASNAPVTRAEAAKVLTRLRDMLADILHSGSLKKVSVGLSAESGQVSRDEIVSALDRLAEAAKATYAISLPAQPVNARALVTKNPAVKDAMVRLVKGGYVGQVDSLLCGPGDTVAPQLFGDDIGYFLCRVAELSHVPSSKYSPYLRPDGR